MIGKASDGTTFERLSVLQTCCQLVMKCSMSGSACPTSSQRHLLAVSPPSMLQHTIAFSSRMLLLLSMGHTLHTYATTYCSALKVNRTTHSCDVHKHGLSSWSVQIWSRFMIYMLHVPNLLLYHQRSGTIVQVRSGMS